MSRIGRKPIAIPAGVEVSVDANVVTVKGPKATLTQSFRPEIKIEVENGEIIVSRPDDTKEMKSLHGLTRTLVSNMVTGVSTGFSKELEINGVGYKAAKEGTNLVMSLSPGYRSGARWSYHRGTGTQQSNCPWTGQTESRSACCRNP